MSLRERFQQARVIVVGDAMIDRWVFGHYSKIGPEGVPVFLQERVEDRQGGAANVAENLKVLGCAATLLGKPEAQWPVKTRFYDRTAVFRADAEDCSPIDETAQRAIMDFLGAAEPPHVLVMSDYAKGVCTPGFCRELIIWARYRRVPVIVDPKGADWSKYLGATVATPNQAEWDAVRDGLNATLGIEHVLVTQGPRGMSFCWGPLVPLHIPAESREIFDIVGAGDTVVATLAAGLAIGLPMEEAARLANAAAGVVVAKRGTATCSLAELEAAL